MKILRNLALSLLFLLPAQAEDVHLFIVHTNDTHGHLEAEPEIGSGGFIRTATMIRALKAAFPGRVLVLDGGDMALGTPTSGLFFGLPTAESMKSVGYDAVAIGNHEFNWGQERMAEFLGAIGAPALCANLVETSTGRHPYRAWTVLEKAGVKIGVIGLVAPDTGTRTQPEAIKGWRFLGAEDSAKEALSEMPKVDAVIALTHIGVPADQALAKAVPGIDLIVGGHSHTALQEVVYEGKTPIVQAGCYSRFLGILEVEIDTEEHDVEVESYHLIPIDDSIAPDPQVSAIVEGYSAKVRPILDRVAGKVNAVVSKSPLEDSIDTPLGDLIADAFRAEAGTDVALYNRGGMRSDMAAGPLAVRAIHQLFPFDDHVVVFEATGAQLLDIVEQGASARAKLSPSGLTGNVDKASGRATLMVAGAPLDPKRVYSVATTEFLAYGGDGMAAMSTLKVSRTLPFTRDLFTSYAEKQRAIEAPKAGRLMVR